MCLAPTKKWLSCSLPSRSSWLLRGVSLSSCLSDWASPTPLGCPWSPCAIGSHHIPRFQHFSWASQPWLRAVTSPLNQRSPRCLQYLTVLVFSQQPCVLWEEHCSPTALLPQSKLQFSSAIKIESCKGWRIQKEPARPKSHMENIQSKTNVVLGKENCIYPKAECRGSAEFLKPGLSKASITFLMVASHSTTHCSHFTS